MLPSGPGVGLTNGTAVATGAAGAAVGAVPPPLGALVGAAPALTTVSVASSKTALINWRDEPR